MGKNKNSTTITLRISLRDAEALREASRLSHTPINVLMKRSVQERAEAARQWLLTNQHEYPPE
jgi:hypothetical protein